MAFATRSSSVLNLPQLLGTPRPTCPDLCPRCPRAGSASAQQLQGIPALLGLLWNLCIFSRLCLLGRQELQSSQQSSLQESRPRAARPGCSGWLWGPCGSASLARGDSAALGTAGWPCVPRLCLLSQLLAGPPWAGWALDLCEFVSAGRNLWAFLTRIKSPSLAPVMPLQ